MHCVIILHLHSPSCAVFEKIYWFVLVAFSTYLRLIVDSELLDLSRSIPLIHFSQLKWISNCIVFIII